MKYIIIALLVAISSCRTSDIGMGGHYCKWEKCPYKGTLHHEKSVILYIQSDDKEAYWLDMYHLDYPELEYEELEELYYTRQLTQFI